MRQPPGSWKPPLKLHLKAASFLAFKFPKQNLLRELKDKTMRWLASSYSFLQTQV